MRLPFVARLSRRCVRLLVVLIVAVASACARPPVQTQPDAPIDTLAFVIGDGALWPRRGTQLQQQIVNLAQREVCWVKYGNPRAFECWRWDDRWIYHEVDHALDGDAAGRSYSFSDGRWLPRRLSRTWTLDVRRNREIDYAPDCRASDRPFPYRLRAYIEPARDLGGDLGSRRTLVLEYEPYAPGAPPTPATRERFHFAEGAGWYAWDSTRGAATFDRIGGPSITRTSRCGESAK